MRKKANVLKKAAALLAVCVGGVVFCCSRRAEDVDVARDAADRVMIAEVSLDPVRKAEDPADPADGSAHSVQPIAEAGSKPESETEPGIWVYVCGAVRSPGVYFVAEDARVFEAVDMAGGFLPDAREDAVNLAELMTDGERIFVPDFSGAGADGLSMDVDGAAVSSGKVNINRADVSELMTLPGIGESKAQAIVSYRQEHPFQSIEEIMNVSGIKEGSFEKIRDLITT